MKKKIASMVAMNNDINKAMSGVYSSLGSAQSAIPALYTLPVSIGCLASILQDQVTKPVVQELVDLHHNRGRNAELMRRTTKLTDPDEKLNTEQQITNACPPIYPDEVRCNPQSLFYAYFPTLSEVQTSTGKLSRQPYYASDYITKFFTETLTAKDDGDFVVDFYNERRVQVRIVSHQCEKTTEKNDWRRTCERITHSFSFQVIFPPLVESNYVAPSTAKFGIRLELMACSTPEATEDGTPRLTIENHTVATSPHLGWDLSQDMYNNTPPNVFGLNLEGDIDEYMYAREAYDSYTSGRVEVFNSFEDRTYLANFRNIPHRAIADTLKYYFHSRGFKQHHPDCFDHDEEAQKYLDPKWLYQYLMDSYASHPVNKEIKQFKNVQEVLDVARYSFGYNNTCVDVNPRSYDWEFTDCQFEKQPGISSTFLTFSNQARESRYHRYGNLFEVCFDHEKQEARPHFYQIVLESIVINAVSALVVQTIVTHLLRTRHQCDVPKTA